MILEKILVKIKFYTSLKITKNAYIEFHRKKMNFIGSYRP